MIFDEFRRVRAKDLAWSANEKPIFASVLQDASQLLGGASYTRLLSQQHSYRSLIDATSAVKLNAGQH